MATTIQRALQDRRRFGYRPTFSRDFKRTVHADAYILSRMTLEKELEGHGGCVNSLYWSRGGDKLLSGSDDKTLIIWQPFEGYEAKCRIMTGHQANIFSAKFMPNTSDQVIVSAAGDTEVRVFDVNPSVSGTYHHGLRHMYACHSDPVKRIAHLDDSPHEFLTCSEDGTVRHFDLRQPHICSPHEVRSFLTASRRPARSFPRPQGDHVRDTCPNPLVDYSKYGIDLNTLSVNKLRSHYFAIGGADDFIYLHDRRMAGRRQSSGTSSSRCIKRFTSTSDRRRRNKHVTACRFSDANGQELLGSWSSDGIYLFNIQDSPIETPSQGTLQQTSARRGPQRGLSTPELDDPVQKIIRLFRAGQLNDVLDALDDYLTDFSDCPDSWAHGATIESAELEDQKNRFVWGLVMSAATHLRRIYELDYGTHNSDYFRGEEQSTAQLKLNEARRAVPATWQGLWCLAVGFWMVGGGHETNGNEYRGDWLRDASTYVIKAREALLAWLLQHDQSEPEIDSPPHSPNTGGSSLSSRDNASRRHDYLRMMDLFEQDVEAALEQEEGSASSVDPVSGRERWSWIDDMYVGRIDRHSVERTTTMVQEGHVKRAKQQSSDEDASEERGSEVDHCDSDTAPIAAQVVWPDGTSVPLAATEPSGVPRDEVSSDRSGETPSSPSDSGGRVSPGRRASLVGQDNDVSDDDDDDMMVDSSDEEEMLVDLEAAQRGRALVERDTDIVAHRTKYVGHCNIRTVKDVNFYGPNDEYIVSGSDDGLVFVWSKKTGRIMQTLWGDEDTVNVIQGHPHRPVMAVSGIDDTVKIFSPTSRLTATSRVHEPHARTSYSPSSHMYEIVEVVGRNQSRYRSTRGEVYVTRNMLAAMLATARGGYVFDGLDDEGDLPDCRMQ